MTKKQETKMAKLASRIEQQTTRGGYTYCSVDGHPCDGKCADKNRADDSGQYTVYCTCLMPKLR